MTVTAKARPFSVSTLDFMPSHEFVAPEFEEFGAATLKALGFSRLEPDIAFGIWQGSSVAAIAFGGQIYRRIKGSS